MSEMSRDLETWVIAPTLIELGLVAIPEMSALEQRNLVQLLSATAACESALGRQLCAPGVGTCAGALGLGLYRITPEVHQQVWDTYLIKSPELASRVRGLASQHQFLKNPHRELLTNLGYSSAIAALIYLRALGDQGFDASPLELAQTWSRHFENGTGQARPVPKFLSSYRLWIAPEVQAA